MNKKLLAGIVFAYFFVTPFTVSGQTITATPSPAEASPSATIAPTSVLDKQIQQLKDRVANTVAELRKKDARAYSGTVSELKNGIFNLTDGEGNSYRVKIDPQLTKYYTISASAIKEAKNGKVEEGDFLIAEGTMVDNTVEANSIYFDSQYVVQSGKITEVNKDDYYAKIISTEKDNYTIDIETSTKINILNIQTLKIEKSGFSKFKEGDTVHFVFKKTGKEKEPNRFSAQKILLIPQEYFLK